MRQWLQERRYATPYHWSYQRANLDTYQLRTRVVFELLRLGVDRAPPPRLLDVGCGDARFVADAAERCDAFGLDVSHRALEFARRLVPRAHFVVGRADQLCFADASFDAVTLLDVIEHVPDHRELAVVGEARRVLRPGGRLVISTNTDRSSVEWKHYRHYGVDRFRALFDGLDDVRLVGLVPYFPTLRVWMQVPLVWRLLRHRVRTCAPGDAQIVVGVGTRT